MFYAFLLLALAALGFWFTHRLQCMEKHIICHIQFLEDLIASDENDYDQEEVDELTSKLKGSTNKLETSVKANSGLNK